MGHRAERVAQVAGLCCIFLVVAPISAGRAAPPMSGVKRVLFLHDSGLNRPTTTAKVIAAFVEGTRSGENVPLDLYLEMLDSERFPSAAQSQLTADYLSNRYADRKIDVLFTYGDAALAFARQYRRLFGNPPIVALALTGQIDNATDDVTGMKIVLGIGETLKLARALCPDTRTVVVVDGARNSSAHYPDEVEREMANYPGISLLYLRNRPLDELISRLAAIPDHSIVLFLRQTMRTASENIDSLEGAAQVLRASRVPVFSIDVPTFGSGIVGGAIWQFETDLQRLAQVTRLVANGTSPRDIPPLRPTIQSMIDWRQLERWRIPVSRVPPGSAVLFRRLSFFELYRRYVIAGLLVFTAQFAFIIALLVQRTRRRRAEHALAGREADLRTSYDKIRDLAGRLITAQETERTRIARDLHDDTCQEVARVAVDVSNVAQRLAVPDSSVQLGLSSVHARLAGIAESLRLLSHDLHPSVLQHIGLVAALEAHCAEAERQYDVQVAFIAEGDVEPAEPMVALSLFRIAQEALRNAARHGHARRATVELARREDDLMLSVVDDGVGFDVAAAGHKDGLGLVSMEERARLVQGHLTILSRPQQGTTIAVRVRIDGAAGPQSSGAVADARP